MSMASIPLPPDLNQFVQDQLAKGKYHSAADVVCDAVRLMREREIRLESLRQEIDRGINQVENDDSIDIDSEAELEAFFGDIAAGSENAI